MSMSPYPMDTRRTGSMGRLVIIGIISAILGFLFIPEIFGSIAIIIGAYIWKKEPESSTGLIVLLVGLILMLASIEIIGPTFYIGYLLPS
jgi:membrane-bound ClpP family serine protease